MIPLIPKLIPDREMARRVVKMPSAIILIVMNLIPVYGVFFLDWKVGYILALYWLENVAVGVINVLKIMTASGHSGATDGTKSFLVPFFTMHYGIFCLVHGVFVFAIFQEGDDGRSFGRSFGPFGHAATVLPALLWPAAGLFASHLFSFFKNYIMGGEYLKKSPALLMIAPYGRVVILHVTIIFGGFVTMLLGSPKPVILLLVFLKIMTDLALHLNEHPETKKA